MESKTRQRLEVLAGKQPVSWDEYLKSLTARGIRSTGSGEYAVVYNHPTLKNVVVKVVDDDDKPYFRYLDWVLRNQNNPWVPRILEVVDGDSPEIDPKLKGYDSYSFVFMERLHWVPPHKLDNLVVEDLKLGAYDYDPDRHYQFQTRVLHEALLSLPEGPLKKLVGWLYNQRAYRLDFHDGNFMQRSNGQVVFIDPLV